jgi:hypothetical protein
MAPLISLPKKCRAPDSLLADVTAEKLKRMHVDNN